MRDGVLPAAVLCAALGLWLGFAPRRAIPPAVLALVVAAAAASVFPPPIAWRGAVVVGCFGLALLAAAAVHLPRGPGFGPAVASAAAAGVLAGAAVALAGRPVELLKVLPPVLLCLPAGWLVARRRALPVKILASWLAAVALLSAGLTAAQGPTSGADHVD